jgi:hypothetical protein
VSLRCFIGLHDPVSGGVPSSKLAPEELTCRRCGRIQYVYKDFVTRWRTVEYWHRVRTSDLRGRT